MGERNKQDNLVIQASWEGERENVAGEHFVVQREEGEECSVCRRPRWKALTKGTGGKQEQKGELEGS